MPVLQNLLALAAGAVSSHVHGVGRMGTALLILVAGFLAAALGGRLIALVVRVALVVAGVLVAAKVAGMGL